MSFQVQSVLLWVIGAIVAWRLSWLAIYSVTGFHLSSISINNGIAIKRITLTRPGMTIAIGCVRFRLWGNSRKVIVDDVTIALDHTTEKKKKKKKPREAVPNNDPHFNVYPSQRYLLRAIARFIMVHLPTIDLELRNLQLEVAPDTGRVEYVKLNVHVKKPVDETIKIISKLTINNASQVKESFVSPYLMANFQLTYSIVVNLKSGIINNAKVRAFVNESRVSVFNCIKYFVDLDKESGEKPKNGNGDSKLHLLLLRLHATIAELSFHFENSQINDIPFASLQNNQSIAGYFSDDKPGNSLSLSIKSFAVNLERLYEFSAGYDYLFGSANDNPLHLTCALQLLKLRYDVADKPHDEILMIPHYSLTCKSNIFNHLLHGRGFRDCLLEYFATTSSPVLDLTTVQVSELLYNIILVSKYLKVGRKKTTTVSQNNNSRFSSMHIIHLLNEVYPIMNIKLISEQPRIFIRHHVPGKTQLINVSYSLLNFHLSTTESRDYHSNCDILSPSVVYVEKQKVAPSDAVMGSVINLVKVENFNLTVHILKNLRADVKLRVDSPAIDLSKLKSLIGLNKLLEDFVEGVQKDISAGILNIQLNSRIEKEKPVPKKPSEFKLPDWLIQANVEINSCSILLGSRSVLIPRHLMGEIGEEGLCEDFVGSNQELRYVQLGFDGWNAHLGKKSDEWIVSTELKNLFVFTKTDLAGPKGQMLKVPSIRTTSYASERLHMDLDVDSIEINYDRYKLFTILGCVYVLREFFLEPIKTIRQRLKHDYGRMAKKGGHSPPPDFSLSVKIASTEVIAHLSDDFKIRLQSLDTCVKTRNGTVTLDNGFIRGMAESPLLPSQWARVFCIDSLKMLKDPRMERIKVMTDSIRFIQPHRFVVHRLFDSISMTAKMAKSLVRLLNSDDKESTILPKESDVIALPPIMLLSKQVGFRMEDDPFECELGMIFQLGLVEQKKRLEQLSIFETHANAEHVEDHKSKLQDLYESFSASWLRKVRVYRASLNKEITDNEKFLFGNEVTIDSNLNDNVVAYPIAPPLLSIYMKDLALEVKQPSFSADYDLSQFLYDIGQHQPKDTKYSLMVPTYLNLSLSELRMHLRDYPLPLLHVPSNNEGPCLRMKGHMIVAEALVDQKEHMKSTRFSLIRNLPKVPPYHSLTIAKSLSTVKLFTDMQFSFHTVLPSRFVWGQSYAFGIQQIMLNFDTYSKSPIDPSTKLGFWDKLKLVMHGRCQVRTTSRLEVAFKGSSDPYDLFTVASGFVLSFEDKVVWNINENDDSRSFIKIHSENVRWYIPNYLAAPLSAWTRDTFIFLPSSETFVTSVFGYYLGAPVDASSSTRKVLEKIVVNLKGGVDFTVGFLLQRKVPVEERTEYNPRVTFNFKRSGNTTPSTNSSKQSFEVNPFTPRDDSSITTGGDENDVKEVSEYSRTSQLKPHHQVLLWNPDFCSENHDSFRGFRSDYIHMAITLHANKETAYNSIHLSPDTFEHFFKWWKLFNGDTLLPVRRGPLFGEAKKSQKFSQSLFTNKFDFNFNSVFISHIYRDKNGAEDLELDGGVQDDFECVGMRAKMESFSMDLHQRKEPRILVKEGTDEKIQTMKMNFNVGEIHLSGIDVRVVRSMFAQTSLQDEKKVKWNLYGKDKRWYDIQDYEEAFKPSLEGSLKSVDIHPLLYSKRFSYVRDTSKDNSNDDGFGDENSHKCTLNSHSIYHPHMEAIEERIRELQSWKAPPSSRENPFVTPPPSGDDPFVTPQRSTRDFFSTPRKVLSRQFTREKAEKPKVVVDELSQTLNERIKFLRNELDKLRNRENHGHASASSSSDANFHNKFVLVNMFLKWNCVNRNNLLKYIHFVQYKKYLAEFLSYDSINAIDKIIEGDYTESARSLSNHSRVSSKLNQTHETSTQRLKRFDEILRRIKPNEKISEDYLIKIISPQIQLQSDDSPNSAVLVTSPRIDCSIISVLESSDSLMANPREFENRLGVKMKMANIFVLNREDVEKQDSFIYSKQNYGSKSQWPPWLGLEICKRPMWAGQDKLLVEKTSFMMTYEQSKLLSGRVEDEEAEENESESHSEAINSLQIDFPKLVISSTSSQYFKLFMIVTGLFFYTEPMSKTIREKLEMLRFSINFQNLESLRTRLVALHRYNILLETLLKNYSFRQNEMDNEMMNEFLQLAQEKIDVNADIYLMMKAISAGDMANESSGKEVSAKWWIRADEIILHMLEDDRTPMLDLAMAGAQYSRIINEDGSEGNTLAISMMQGFSLIDGAECPAFLEPYGVSPEDGRDLLRFKWNMNKSIGGIKIIENVDIASLPLNIRIDEITGMKLMKFIFGSDSDIEDSPLLTMTKKQDKDQEEEDDESNEDDAESTSRRNSSESKAKSNKSPRVPWAHSSGTSLGDDMSSSHHDQVQQMVARSKKYFSIMKLRLEPTSLSITIRLKKGYRRLLNVQDFLLNLPGFTIENKILSFLEITKLLQKMILKTLLSHSGSLLKNKISVKKNKSKAIIGKPLRPLRRYGRFIKVSELVDERKKIEEVR